MSEESRERNALYGRFGDRLRTSETLDRKLVSYQGNKETPGFRWMKYKEGFSSRLVDLLLKEVPCGAVLDPFSGIGTTALTASATNRQSHAIEIMPIGNLTAKAISQVANGMQAKTLRQAASEFIDAIGSARCAEAWRFPHVRITQNAFSQETEIALSQARAFIADYSDKQLTSLLNFVCMTVLEDVSYTRKDGQCLRWDPRSGRTVSTKLNKGELPSLTDCLNAKFEQVIEDAPHLKRRFSGSTPHFVDGSCLLKLKKMPAANIDLVITSPPYANRYDYTRTYALELAFLGFDDAAVKTLRQDLLSATVENKSKRRLISDAYGASQLPVAAFAAVDEQTALKEVLEILREKRKELSNPHVIRLIENYFTEMSVVIAELARVVKPGGSVFMVNDNVQYHGEELPVDFILSDLAEQFGFHCKTIWKLKRGKGNASQQMGRYGRTEIRKCLYHWVRRNGH